MLSGPSYILPMSTARCLYDAAMKIPYFHLEDVFTTGFAAEMCGVPRCHMKGFYNFKIDLKKNPFDFKHEYTRHYVPPNEQIEILKGRP